MNITVEVITPERAVELLANNPNNRNIRKSRVTVLARAMKQGDWAENGAAIRVASDGRLMDGQHRLTACVQSGVPFKTVVITGLSFGVMSTVDRNARRRFADELKIMQIPRSSRMSAVTRAYASILLGPANGLRPVTYTSDELMRLFHEHPAIKNAVLGYVKPVRKLVRASAPTLAWIAYLSERAEWDELSAFLDRFLNGVKNPAEHDAIKAIRETLLRNFHARLAKQNVHLQGHLIVKAWTYHREGRPIRSVRLAPDEIPYMYLAGLPASDPWAKHPRRYRSALLTVATSGVS